MYIYELAYVILGSLFAVTAISKELKVSLEPDFRALEDLVAAKKK
jgi:hypothetical protein